MSDKIKCPNCGHIFDVEEALSGKLEAQFKAEFEKKIAEQATKFNVEKKKLDSEKEQFQLQKEQQDDLIKVAIKKQWEQQKASIEKSAKESSEEQIKALQEENEKRRAENKTLRQKEVNLLKKESELKEKQEDLQLEMEKQLLDRQKEIEDKARSNERESFELEKAQLLKQIEENKKLAAEMKRRVEEGSGRVQGEIQETELEKLLAKTYPFDKIDEVPKGVRGADSIQTVINSNQVECGTIVYESKRTKSFSNDWIGKLKQDQSACKADIAVLVTQSLPKDMLRFGERNGIWICTYQEVTSLSFVLREMLVRMNSVKQVQVNKGDKMELLYNYLTSTEFVQNIDRIVENYDAMINQLNSEKKAMHKIWASREKYIWVVQENISALFGSIKGIAGTSLNTANVLQLPDTTIDD